MPLYGAEVPQLILVQPFGLAFLVIDFHRPAMATNPGDAGACQIKRLLMKKVGLSDRSAWR